MNANNRNWQESYEEGQDWSPCSTLQYLWFIVVPFPCLSHCTHRIEWNGWTKRAFPLFRGGRLYPQNFGHRGCKRKERKKGSKEVRNI